MLLSLLEGAAEVLERSQPEQPGFPVFLSGTWTGIVVSPAGIGALHHATVCMAVRSATIPVDASADGKACARQVATTITCMGYYWTSTTTTAAFVGSSLFTIVITAVTVTFCHC